MKWVSPVLLAALLSAAAWVGAGDGTSARQPRDRRAESDPRAVAPRGDSDQGSVRFETVDVFVDSGSTGLAAWQLEATPLAADGAKVTLVGIEGGEHAAFSKPAYYDPAALSPAGGGRVILAAYSTDKDLPTGRTRVARLHMMIEGGGAADRTTFSVTLKVAADSQGRPIDGASAAVSEAREASTGGDR